MREAVSPLLISVGQTAAVLVYLLYGQPDAFRERRLVRLRAVGRGETVILTVRNTFQTRPGLKNGLPATTKADAKNHGYGLRNMRYIAERYNGTLSCRIEEEEFVLCAVLERESAAASCGDGAFRV